MKTLKVDRTPNRNNKSGYKWATEVSPGRWIARYRSGGKNYYLGVYDNARAAREAVCRALGIDSDKAAA